MVAAITDTHSGNSCVFCVRGQRSSLSAAWSKRGAAAARHKLPGWCSQVLMAMRGMPAWRWLPARRWWRLHRLPPLRALSYAATQFGCPHAGFTHCGGWGCSGGQQRCVPCVHTHASCLEPVASYAAWPSPHAARDTRLPNAWLLPHNTGLAHHSQNVNYHHQKSAQRCLRCALSPGALPPSPRLASSQTHVPVRPVGLSASRPFPRRGAAYGSRTHATRAKRGACSGAAVDVLPCRRSCAAAGATRG